MAKKNVLIFIFMLELKKDITNYDNKILNR